MTDNKTTPNKSGDDELVAVPPPKKTSSSSSSNASSSSSNNGDQVAVPPPSKGGNSNTALKVILIVIAIVVILGILTFAAIAWFFKSAADTVGDAINETTHVSKTADGKANFSIGDKGNSYEVSEKSLPDDFPSEVLMLNNQKIVSSSKMKISGSKIFTIVTEVDKSSADANEQLSNMYKNQGDWESIVENQYNDLYSSRYKNTKNSELSVGTTVQDASDGDNTTITYSVSISKEDD